MDKFSGYRPGKRRRRSLLSATLFDWWTNNHTKPVATTRRSRRGRSHLESLEPRRLLAVSVADLTVSEGVGVAQVVITNTPTSSTPITFDASTGGNTATGGADYGIRFTSLTIPANESSVTFDVNILEDTTPEPSEQFTVSISNAVGTTVADNRAVITIEDNDTAGNAEVSISDLTINENVGTAEIVVSLSEAATSPVRVRAATSGGTAGSTDFIANNQTLVFEPGVTSQRLSVTIIDDETQESTEDFLVQLSSPIGATISDSSAVVTILDNDAPVSDNPLIAVDFDSSSSQPSPNNWTQSTVSINSHTDLIDETGAATEIDLAISNSGFRTGFGALEPPVIPTHSNSLDGIGGGLDDSIGLTFTYSDLEPGTTYEVFVFAQKHTNSQTVTITGENTVGFEQSLGGTSLHANRQLATTDPLDTFAELVIANASGEITITVSEVTASDEASVNALAIRKAPEPPPETTRPLIGVDFDSSNSQPTPTNWTQAGISDLSLTSLIDETGAATGIDLTVTHLNSSRSGFGALEPPVIPSHENSLHGIGGGLDNAVGIEFVYSGLIPGGEYEIFVFGQTHDFTQTVTISGENTIGPFHQALSVNGRDMVINREVATTAPLNSFAELVTANASGEIMITVSELTADDVVKVNALAIREVVEPPPVLTGPLIGIDFDVLSASPPSPNNWTTAGLADRSLTNLIDENGDATGVSLQIVGTTQGAANGVFDPPDVPSHDNSLAGLGGSVGSSVGPVTYTYSGLKPGIEYEVFVFGGVGNNTQQVTITGANSVGPFVQAKSASGPSWVNGKESNSAPLHTFAERVTADSSGEIRIDLSQLSSTIVWLNGLAIREVIAPPPTTAALIGVDFDVLSSGPSSPNNWNVAGLTTPTLSNLIDESGASTNVSLLVTGATQGSSHGGQDPPNLPTHDNSLAGIAGDIGTINDSMSFTYSGLSPGAVYEVYVFARQVNSQEVTISGANSVGPFSQSSPHPAMLVNAQQSSNANLDAFAELVAADGTGEITITVSKGTTTNPRILGLAIREIIEPLPSSDLVGIDFGTPTGPTNWTPVISGDKQLFNLIDESGSATEIDLEVTTTGAFAQTASPANFPDPSPTHNIPLDEVVSDGIVGGEEIRLKFSDLSPGATYEIFVFGGQDPFTPGSQQSITMTGGSVVGPFIQTAAEPFVNRLPTSVAPLSSFSESVTADASGEITVSLTEVDPAHRVVLRGVAIRETAAPPPLSELVGIDFDFVDGRPAPDNWTHVQTLDDLTLTNLIDETGTATATDLSIAFTAPQSARGLPNNLAVAPSHSNDLTDIGGSLNDGVGLTLTFSDLTPSADYEVFVFARNPESLPVRQILTISGQTTVGPIVQDTSEFVVNQFPISDAPLDTFAQRVTATEAGEIVITIDEETEDDFASISGLAIREILASTPALPDVSVLGAEFDERDGTVNVRVQLSKPSANAVTASVLPVDGTATEGQDFIVVDPNFVIPAGEVEALIPIQIFDDTDVEPDETFELFVNSSVGANLGARGDFTITGLEFRTIDGTANQPGDKGAADTQVIRFGYPHGYVDDIGDDINELKTEGLTPNPSFTLPNPRDVSNAIMSQSESIKNGRNLSDWIVQWGQFVTHDMDLTINGAEFNTQSTGAVGDFSIPILDPNDPLGPSPIRFNRSKFDPDTGTATPRPNGADNSREQINEITSFIDASNVYGSDPVREAELRSFVGGKLEVSAGNLPHLNTAGLPNDNNGTLPDDQMFLGGDVRANEQTGLTAAHTLFVREHNRLADIIAAQNPAFDDEQIYQWARRIVGAQMQIITYEEYLPALMGDQAPDPNAVRDRLVDPSITNSFANAFFRFGHTMQSPDLELVDNDGVNVGTLSLRDAFFRPDRIIDDPTIVDLTVKGLATQAAQENDILLVDDIRNFLFGPPGAGGLDLGALDLQRGRDHGLLSFNEFRLNYGLARLNSFDELTSDPALAAALEAIYVDINHVEAFVGGIAEDHEPGTSVGSMLIASLTDQFERLRDGDQFFYTVDPSLQDPIITDAIDLDNFTLAELIRNNTAITNIQDNVFFAPGSISGTSWLDSNNDGLIDPSESSLPGMTVFLDANSNGVLDPGESSAVTDVHGNYVIQNVFPGSHRIMEVTDSSLNQVQPRVVTMQPGEDLGSINFAHELNPGLLFDAGDAPDGFPVTVAENGARHLVSLLSPTLGPEVSASANAVHSPLADGDSADDGVNFSELQRGTDNTISIEVTRADGFVDAWIDFNQNGNWDDPGEKIIDGEFVEVGSTSFSYMIPQNVALGDTFARVRLSSFAGLLPTGLALDGEVEDYLVAVVDSPEVSVSDVTANEGENAAIEFTLSRASDRPIVVSYITTDGTAKSPGDFAAVTSQSVVIPAGELSAQASILLETDDVYEISETFDVQIAEATDALIDDGTATVTITNTNDLPTISLSINPDAISESGGTAQGAVTIDAVTEANTTLDLVATGSASGRDFLLSTSSIVIPAGQTEATFTLEAVGDETDEPDEFIDISFSSLVNAREATSQSQRVTINDDDNPPEVSLSVDSNLISEGGGSATGTVSIAAVSELDVSVQLAISGTAQSPGDFTLTPTTLSIPAGSTQANFAISAIADAIDESNETIIIEVASTSGSDADAQTLTVTITDDDTIPIIRTTADDPTNLAAIPITVDFGESVNDFVLADVQVSGGVAGNFVDQGNGLFSLDVTPSADGLITVDVPAAAATGLDGNGSLAALQLTFESDRTVPTPTISGPVLPTANDPFIITIDFGESVSGFGANDINARGGAVTGFSDDGNGVFTATIDASGDAVIDIEVLPERAVDNAGNLNPGASIGVLVDTTAPLPLISGPSDPVVTSPFEISIDFAENVSGFESSDLSVNGGMVVSIDSPIAGLYVATINGTVDGAVFINLPAGSLVDDAGNANRAASFAVVVDDTAPVINATPILTVEADALGGTAASNPAIVSLLSPTVTDLDTAPTLTHDAPSFFALGETLVTFTATDAAGNQSTEISRVLVIDTTGPSLTAASDLTVEADSIGGAGVGSHPLVVSFLNSVNATDVVDGPLIVTNDAPDLFPIGDTLVTFTAWDKSGNNSTVSATVTVTDTTKPVFDNSVPTHETQGDTIGGANAAGPLFSEFFEGFAVSDVVDSDVTLTHDAPDLFPLGDTIVTFVAVDDHGNQQSVTSVVTVHDQAPPQLETPNDISVEADTAGGADPAGAEIATLLVGAIGTDIVDPDVTISHDAPDLFPVGETIVTYTATDDSSNESTATAKVTVTDTTEPTLTVPADVTVEGDITGGADSAGAAIAAFLFGASATDVVDDDVTISHDAPTLLATGETIVTFTATDDSGNASTATAKIIVIDETSPTLVVPGDITVEGDLIGGADSTGNAIAEFLNGATADDTVYDDIVITHDAPELFPIGDTVVTFTATDGSGNSSSDTAIVSVTDTTPPTLIGPSDIGVEGDTSGGAISTGSTISTFLANVTASDIVDSDVMITHNAPALFPVGETVVTFTATDDSGNASTATAVVTVTDTLNALLTVPGDITVEGDVTGGATATGPAITAFLSAAEARDIVYGNVSITHNAPDLFPLGATIVTFTATDSSGNSSVASAVVTVTDTTTATLTVPDSISVEADVSAGADPAGALIAEFLSGAVAMDIVDEDVDIINDAPSTFPVGDTVVTFTASDDSGNTSAASSTITVLDTTPPLLAVPDDIVVEGDVTGGADAASETLASFLSGPSGTDIVDGDVVVTNDAPNCFRLGKRL